MQILLDHTKSEKILHCHCKWHIAVLKISIQDDECYYSWSDSRGNRMDDVQDV